MRLMWIVFWVLVVLMLIASFLVAYTIYGVASPPTSTPFFEATKAFLLCLGGASVVLSTYFTAVNAFSQRESDRLKNTFELITSWDDPHLFAARKLTRKLRASRGDISDNQLVEMINGDEDLKNSVILVLNYFEHVRFSLKTNRVDKAHFKEALGEAVVDISDRFMPFARTLPPSVEKDLTELKALLR